MCALKFFCFFFLGGPGATIGSMYKGCTMVFRDPASRAPYALNLMQRAPRFQVADGLKTLVYLLVLEGEWGSGSV